MNIYLIKLAWLNLLRNGRRSLLSVMIIAIAVFAITSAGGYGLYTYDSLKEMAARDTGHLTLSLPGYFEKDEETPLSNGLMETKTITNQIMKEDKVRGIQPRIYFNGLISNGNKSTIFVGTGVNEREFAMKGPFLDVKQGNTLMDINSSRYDPAEPQVMLAKDLAKNLQVSVGDWVTLLATTTDGALNAFDFKVQGIYGTGVPDLDKREIYIHVSMAQELLVSEKVSTLSVFLFETEATAQIQQKLEKLLPELPMEQEIEITSWEERAFFYKKVKDLYDGIFGMMGIILGIVVFVSLFNSMTTSVTERTREIGTLSALGSYPGEIIAGFIREAGLLALLGAVFGTLATACVSGLLMVVDVQMPPPPGSTEGYPLFIYFSFELAAYAALGVMFICLVAAFFSARRGVRKPITEALTYV